MPILGYGLDRTITIGLLRSSAYAEVIILAVFAGSLQGISHIKKAGYISLFISGLLISAGLLSFSLAFEYTSTQEITAPIYEMTRMLKFRLFLKG